MRTGVLGTRSGCAGGAQGFVALLPEEHERKQHGGGGDRPVDGGPTDRSRSRVVDGNLRTGTKRHGGCGGCNGLGKSGAGGKVDGVPPDGVSSDDAGGYASLAELECVYKSKGVAPFYGVRLVPTSGGMR